MEKAFVHMSRKQMDRMNDILYMSADNAYKKYGLKRDEVLSFQGKFPDGTECDLRITIGEGEDFPDTSMVIKTTDGEEEEYEAEIDCFDDGEQVCFVTEEEEYALIFLET